ncbi:MAG: hypothetical protein DRJ10_06345 [Bacteroidetes bacterium]|nr:MAG: hypothetical protein DRJ10_06345 [Bacteroidota bacterium]
MKVKILLFLIAISFFVSCIEEFSPKIDSYINLPVVEGIITNESGPYIIRLSRSAPFYSLDYYPISGANIVISDDLNNEETLIELEPGIYTTDSLGIRGEVGRKYRLTINIDNKIYQSNYEKLEAPLEIDSIYAKIEYKDTREGNFEGMQFYIDTKATNTDNRYFLWIPIETYKYRADLTLDHFYISSGTRVVPNNDTMHVCWRTNNVSGIFTYSSKHLTETKLHNFPLHYVNTKSKKLTEKYSVLVNQYSITQGAFRYWNLIKKQTSESGSLYSTQPFQIKGNMVNPDKPDDIILGYFMAASVSKKRFFVNRPRLSFDYYICKANTSAYESWLKSPGYPAYFAITDDGLGKALLGCFDCREQGGTTTKPDFWED